jgi:hypothetical protein
MRVKLTRRGWAAVLAGSAVPVLSQAPASQRKDSPDELLAEAKARVKRRAERLHKFPLPMATEPAFLFKA